MPARLYIITLLLTLLPAMTRAQKFAVRSFEYLPTEISAFVNTVNDLNGDGCALIKVEAGPDFAFSTPLGIVKREDKVGEIWLYVPRGTKKLTIKHPEWGVLRDYVLPLKIESLRAYALRIDEPSKAYIISGDAPMRTVTVVDTLVIQHTDTVTVVERRKPVEPWVTAALTYSYGGRSKSGLGGILVAAGRRTGGFVHLSTDFGRSGATAGSCDRDGATGGRTPFYSGAVRHACTIVNGGVAQSLGERVTAMAGIGYGTTGIAWQLAGSEGGGWMDNSAYRCRGVAFEAGAVVKAGRVSLTVSVLSIKGREWYGSAGAGITIGKKTKLNRQNDATQP